MIGSRTAARVLIGMGLCLLGAGAARAELDAFDQRFGLRIERIDFPAVYRLGLMEGDTKVSFDAPTRGWLRAGDAVETVPAGVRVTVTRTDGKAARIAYHLCLATFEAARLAEADQAVAGYQADGMAARLVPWGARLVADGSRPLHDHRRVVVAVETTEDLEEAEQLVRSYSEAGMRPFLHEELLEAPEVTVSVRAGGTLLYQGPAPVNFSADGGKLRVFDVRLGVGEPWASVKDLRYRGSLVLAPDRFGQLGTVNVSLHEDYLKGVVPAEILPSAPDAALRAQAIAARGESLAKYNLRHAPDPYDLCSQTHCQVYAGMDRETDRTSAAVDATTGVVMQLEGKIVDAVYSAVCGGHSEHNENVWSSPPDPALRGRRDGTAQVPSPVTEENLEAFLAATSAAWCKNGGDRFRWTKTLDQAAMQAGLAARGIELGRLRDLIPGERGVSGRLRSLRVVGELGETVIQKELPIRLTFDKLRSALFRMVPTRDAAGFLEKVTFQGAGWGHGVGLCQVGTRARAEAGQSHEQILKAYFAGISLVRVDQAAGIR